MGYQESLNHFKKVDSLQRCIEFLEFIGKDYFQYNGFQPVAICKVKEHLYGSADNDISKGRWVIYFVGERYPQREITVDLYEQFEGSDFKKVLKPNGHRMMYIEEYLEQCEMGGDGRIIEKMEYYPILKWDNDGIKVETPRMRRLKEQGKLDY